MSRPARRTLAWRLYALGLVQLVLLATSVMGVGWLIRGSPPDESGPPPMHEPMADRPPPPEMRSEPPPSRGGRPSPVAPLLTFLLSGLIIVGVGAFWTARWIVTPVERLSDAARTLGAGDLRARTGLDRDDELGDLGRAFDEMAVRIEKLRSAEQELLANVSHELRTPLARIRVALDIAGEGDAETNRASRDEIAIDLAELDALIEDIFTATRLAVIDGKAAVRGFALHTEDIGPEVVVGRAAERFRVRHPRRSLTVVVDEGLPMVSVDPALLRRALDNLLENADKYSPDAVGTITLWASPADTGLNTASGVSIEVSDHGIGIPAADLPHLFTPFFRGERSRSRGTGGVGLGLTLARRIVEAHGGAIDVRSVVDQGTTVRVTLPAKA